MRLGREAAEALLARLGPRRRGQTRATTLIDLSLVVRESTAPPKA
jgi:DNA-binding LacI/PurR family transcriptional regulator